MFFDILTLFPAMFGGVFSESIIGRAREKRLIDIHVHDIREYASDRHKTVDDYPYGGDAGMVLKPEPLALAIADARRRQAGRSTRVVLLSARGTSLRQELVVELTKLESLVLVCGHYKDVDQRIVDRDIDIEISTGDYVLSGGEIAAMTIVDAVTRLIPGVLGNSDSAEGDSFFAGLLGPPHYTRPEVFEGMRVPEVLLSGHHENIRRWQLSQAETLTQARRSDLWEKYRERKARAGGEKKRRHSETNNKHT